MYPALHLNIYDLRNWLQRDKLSLKQLHDKLNDLRIKLRDAIDYKWDNNHFFIDDGYGKAALVISLYPDGSGFSLWNYRNGVSLGHFTKFDDKQIEKFLDEIHKNKTMCNDCGKWIPNETVKHYSFAGAVCPKCYNPKKHLPPDTRGD